MTVCPIAIVAGCRKCPAVSMCPLKEVLGDFDDADEAPTQSTEDSSDGKPQGD
ncbi:MAG: hypothetical protein ACI9DC_005175 [Gammaproteobacteria bacterium]|jgi:hypothetical protein